MTRNSHMILHLGLLCARADSLPTQGCWCSSEALVARLQGMLHGRLRQHGSWQASQLAR